MTVSLSTSLSTIVLSSPRLSCAGSNFTASCSKDGFAVILQCLKDKICQQRLFGYWPSETFQVSSPAFPLPEPIGEQSKAEENETPKTFSHRIVAYGFSCQHQFVNQRRSSPRVDNRSITCCTTTRYRVWTGRISGKTIASPGVRRKTSRFRVRFLWCRALEVPIEAAS